MPSAPPARPAAGSRATPVSPVLPLRLRRPAGAGVEARLGGGDPMLASGHAAFLGVPVDGPEGMTVGVLAVYASVPRDWREEEIEALLAVAASTSAALSNAGLYQPGGPRPGRSGGL